MYRRQLVAFALIANRGRHTRKTTAGFTVYLDLYVFRGIEFFIVYDKKLANLIHGGE